MICKWTNSSGRDSYQSSLKTSLLFSSSTSLSLEVTATNTGCERPILWVLVRSPKSSHLCRDLCLTSHKKLLETLLQPEHRLVLSMIELWRMAALLFSTTQSISTMVIMEHSLHIVMVCCCNGYLAMHHWSLGSSIESNTVARTFTVKVSIRMKV